MKHLPAPPPGLFPTRAGRRQGFSVLEAVVAVFILVAATAISAKMLGISLRASGTVRDEAIALLLAERRFNEIERWASDAGATRFNFDDDTAWPSAGERFDAWPFKEQPSDEHPDFLISATSRKVVLAAPFKGGGQTRFERSARVVQVTVAWGKADMRARTLSISGLITEPLRTVSSIAFSPSKPATLGTEPLTLTVQGRDESGEAIPDLVYRWEVVPLSGNITVAVQRGTNGSVAVLTNAFTYPDGQRRRTGGRCRVRVRASCGGREHVETMDLDLESAGGMP